MERVKNTQVIQQEKGEYYPYIMQILGCPVIEGIIIPIPSMKYLYSGQIAGIFEVLLGICRVNSENPSDYSDKVFPKISKREFVFSMENALSDCFFDGCDLEDYDRDKTFQFFNYRDRNGDLKYGKYLED